MLLLIPFTLFIGVALMLPGRTPTQLLQWLAMFLPYYIAYFGLYNLSILPLRAHHHLRAMYPKLAAYVSLTPLAKKEKLPLSKTFTTKGLAFPQLNIDFKTRKSNPLRGIRAMEWDFSTRILGNIRDSVFLSKHMFIPRFMYEGTKVKGSLGEKLLHVVYVSRKLRQDKLAWGEFTTMLNKDARLKELIQKLDKPGLRPEIDIRDIGDSAHIRLTLLFNPLYDTKADAATICEIMNRLSIFVSRYAEHVFKYGAGQNFHLDNYLKMQVPLSITAIFYAIITSLFLILFTAFQFFIGLPWYIIRAMDYSVLAFMVIYFVLIMRARTKG